MSVNNNQESMMNKEPTTDIPELMDNARNMVGEVSMGEVGTMCWEGEGEVVVLVVVLGGMRKVLTAVAVGVEGVADSTTAVLRRNRHAWCREGVIVCSQVRITLCPWLVVSEKTIRTQIIKISPINEGHSLMERWM